jgi:hypothetical protein
MMIFGTFVRLDFRLGDEVVLLRCEQRPWVRFVQKNSLPPRPSPPQGTRPKLHYSTSKSLAVVAAAAVSQSRCRL